MAQMNESSGAFNGLLRDARHDMMPIDTS